MSHCKPLLYNQAFLLHIPWGVHMSYGSLPAHHCSYIYLAISSDPNFPDNCIAIRSNRSIQLREHMYIDWTHSSIGAHLQRVSWLFYSYPLDCKLGKFHHQKFRHSLYWWKLTLILELRTIGPSQGRASCFFVIRVSYTLAQETTMR